MVKTSKSQKFFIIHIYFMQSLKKSLKFDSYVQAGMLFYVIFKKRIYIYICKSWYIHQGTYISKNAKKCELVKISGRPKRKIYRIPNDSIAFTESSAKMMKFARNLKNKFLATFDKN